METLPSEHIAVDILEFPKGGWQNPHEMKSGPRFGPHENPSIKRSEFEISKSKNHVTFEEVDSWLDGLLGEETTAVVPKTCETFSLDTDTETPSASVVVGDILGDLLLLPFFDVFFS